MKKCPVCKHEKSSLDENGICQQSVGQECSDPFGEPCGHRCFVGVRLGIRPRPKQLSNAEMLNSPTRRAYEKDLGAWYRELESHPHVQEVMNIPTDEPIFVVRSQDINGPATVESWLEQNQRLISPEKFNSAAQRYKEMLEWQNVLPTRAKIPD